MASVNNFLGVAHFRLGAPGDGVMGTSLTDFTDVEVGSVNIEGSQGSNENIPTEGSDAYITLGGEPTPTTVAARLFGVTPAQLVMLAGGELNVSDGLWEAPAAKPEIYMSFRMEGKPNGGRYGVLEMAYAKVDARIQGTVTKNGLPAVDLLITANTPVSELGVQGPPFRYGTLVVE